MSFPRYPEYKDSGVEWLGEVPAHWAVTTFRRAVQIRKRIGGTDGYDVLSITQKGIKVKDIESGDGQLASDYSKYQLVEVGDFAMNHMDLLTGYVDLSRFRGVTSPDYRVFALRSASEFNGRFLLKFLQMCYQQKLFFPWGQGSAQLGRWRLPTDAFNDFPIPVPPPEEQTTIAAFLDRETGKIDTLVAEQEKLIALLKEKRQAVISHAVTKGLNPDAPMKPSGIEWLGDVPAHWNLTRLAWICSAINDINHEMPDAVENGVLFLSAKDLLDEGTLNFTQDVKKISEDDFLRLSKKICPRRGDIIYSRIGARLGKARLVDTDERFLISYSCCVVRVLAAKASAPFIQRVMDGDMILTEARMRTQGIGVPDLGLGEIGRFPITLPPLQEQDAITSFLSEELKILDSLTDDAMLAVSLLKERRSALISAAVTGQIDVRSLVTALPKVETANV